MNAIDDEVQKIIEMERLFLDKVAFDTLGIPEKEFCQLGSSAFDMDLAEKMNMAPDDNFVVEAKRDFDLLCGTVPNIGRDAVKAICLAYSSYELFFGERSVEELKGVDAVSMIWSIAMTRGFAMGAASSSPTTSEVMRKKLLSMAGLSGALAKHKLTSELKRWAQEQAKTMKGSDSQIVKKLVARIPAHLADASSSPERLISDHLRALRKRLASQP